MKSLLWIFFETEHYSLLTLQQKIDAVQILPMDQTAGFEGRKISDVEKPYCMLQPTGDVVRNAYTTGHYTHVNGTREGGDQGC